jgi:hypothetical protein
MFLERHRKGRPRSRSHIAMGAGFLRLRYDDGGDLERVAFVERRGGRATGFQLYFDWANETATFKIPTSLAGWQWVGGRVMVGTVYDNDDDDDPWTHGREVALGEWIDECLATMSAGR